MCLYTASAPTNLSPLFVAKFLKIAVRVSDIDTTAGIPGSDSICHAAREWGNGVVRFRVFE